MNTSKPDEPIAAPAAPRVSVVMPAYNSAAYVVEAVTSVLGQTWRDLELIVVDDGSRDGTVAAVEALARDDARLRLVVQPNSGRPSVARNRGLALARGRYLAFLDSDDVWFPKRVERMVAALDAHPGWVAVFHDLKLIAADGADLHQTYLADADFLARAAPWLNRLGDGWWECDERFFVFMSLVYAAVHTQSVMIARDRLADPGVEFDSGFVVCEDNDLWIRVAMQGRMGYLDQILSAYRQHGSSIIRDPLRYVSESVKFHKKNYLRVHAILSAAERTHYAKRMASLHRDHAYQAYKANDLKTACGGYLQAMRLSPAPRDVLNLVKSWLIIRTRLFFGR